MPAKAGGDMRYHPGMDVGRRMCGSQKPKHQPFEPGSAGELNEMPEKMCGVFQHKGMPVLRLLSILL